MRFVKRLSLVGAPFAYALLTGLGGAKAPGNCNRIGNAQFLCLSATAEDLVAVPNSDWVIVSGELRAINTRSHAEVALFSTRTRLDKRLYSSCPGPLDGKEIADKHFTAHGINLRPGRDGVHTLYVVHHPGRESVEVFEIDVRHKTPAITWIGCAVSPPGTVGNAVTVLPNNGFAITNFVSRRLGSFMGPKGAALRAKMTRGEITGDVWEWNPATGWKVVPGSEGSGPNGIEASKDGRWLYINEWATQKVIRLSRGQTPVKKDVASVDFHPDNLRWQSDGSLLAGGQHGTIDDVLDACLANRKCSNVSTSVARIDPETLQVQELVHQYPSNDFFAAGTTGLIIGKELWVGSTAHGSRIARFTLK